MSKKILIIVLQIILVLLPLSHIMAQEFPRQDILDLHLYYQNNQVDLVYIEKRQSYLPDYLNQPETGHQAILLDDNGRELFKVKFSSTPTIFIDPVDPTQKQAPITPSEFTYTLTLPYFENATKLIIKDQQGKTIIEQELNERTFVTPISDRQPSIEQKEGVVTKIINWFKNLFTNLFQFFKNSFTKKVTPPQPSPSPELTLVQLEPAIQSIADLAPLDAGFMSVNYYPQSQSFITIIKELPFNQTKAQAIKWFQDHGIKNICVMKLYFIAAEELQLELTAEQMLASGCPTP